MKVTTAAELENMTPAERRAHFEASIAWDPDNVDDPRVKALLERSRQRTQARIEASEGSGAS